MTTHLLTQPNPTHQSPPTICWSQSLCPLLTMNPFTHCPWIPLQLWRSLTLEILIASGWQQHWSPNQSFSQRHHRYQLFDFYSLFSPTFPCHTRHSFSLSLSWISLPWWPSGPWLSPALISLDFLCILHTNHIKEGSRIAQSLFCNEQHLGSYLLPNFSPAGLQPNGLSSCCKLPVLRSWNKMPFKC